MFRKEKKGSVTVFLSLTCLLFLAIICTVVESARIQGARTQTANIMGMGNFSLFSEFEKELLERYELFALDGAYGSGQFQKKNLEKRLEHYLSINTVPQSEGISGLCFDPWNLELMETKVKSYALLTDQNGEAFYQQSVSFMKEQIGALAVEQLMQYKDYAEEVRNSQKRYEEIQKNNEGILENLEQEKQQKIDMLESEAQENAANNPVQEIEPALPEEKHNPLKEIAKLRKKSVLELVLADQEVSAKKMSASALPSKGGLKKGSMKVKKEHSGTLANVLFREYLIRYFPDYLTVRENAVLDYQLEYILGGKKTDRDNLKYVVNRLLLLRGAMNYLYAVSDGQIAAQANAAALSLTGFLGIPALTAATGQAIILAWVYGESLLDVRILLDGGKIPLNKTPDSWMLSLENLGQITKILQDGEKAGADGLAYSEYLRMLLHMGSLSSQKMRALDLIQTELQKNGKLPKFQVQNCVVAVETNARWNCAPVFLRIPAVVTKTSGEAVNIYQEGSIGY